MARVLAGLLVVMLAAPLAWAGNPHFVSLSVLRDGDTLTVIGKEAGLGDEDQINVVITATASCINPGSNKPQAANKEDVAAGGLFPVQNGKANFTIIAAVDFQPDCSPPMTVQFTDVRVCDLTNNICRNFSGTF
jgi:hypothetical protein